MRRDASAGTLPEASSHEWAGTRVVFTGRGHGNVSLVVGGGDPVAARRALGPLVGVGAEDLVFMEQVHGTGVAVVGRADAGRGLERHEDAPAGVDALVTTEPDLGLVVLSADCVPVLLAGQGVVAAVHAGRQGLVAGVLQAAVEAVRDLGGDTPQALIGPAVGPCCYEVPADLAADVAALLPRTRGSSRWGTPSLDLPAGAAAALRASGVTEIVETDTCTRCAPERWFSHRAATDGREPGGPQGRQASLIARPSGPSGRPTRLPSAPHRLS